MSFSLTKLRSHIRTDWWNTSIVQKPDANHFYEVFFYCPEKLVKYLRKPLQSDPDVTKLQGYDETKYQVMNWISKVLSPEDNITPAINLIVKWNEVNQNAWNKRMALWDYATFVDRNGKTGIVFVVSKTDEATYTSYKNNFQLDIGQLLKLLNNKDGGLTTLTFGLYQEHWNVTHGGEKKMGTPEDYPIDIPPLPPSDNGNGNSGGNSGGNANNNRFNLNAILTNKYIMGTIALLIFGGVFYELNRPME